MIPLKIFIGYDPRERDAFEVCRASILHHASIPVQIIKLDLTSLQRLGIYTRQYRTEGDQMYDLLDGRPFSTQFSFSRFLVPMLSSYDMWSVFVDCDFLFTDDIAKLVPLLDRTKAAMVVKNVHMPVEYQKMDGQYQASYPRKNWSSFVAYNCSHRANRYLTADKVNAMSGGWLHGFTWIADRELGELPQTWNWLSGVNRAAGRYPNRHSLYQRNPFHEGPRKRALRRSMARRTHPLGTKGDCIMKKHPTGTYAPSGMRMGPGSVKGAGMVMTGGPGKMASKVTPHMAGAKFEGGANSYKPPKMSVQKNGE